MTAAQNVQQSAPRLHTQISGERLRRCLGGEPAAWHQLLTEVEPLVHTIARRDFGLRPEDCDDIYQLVSLKVWENLGQLREERAFPQWLRCLTRRVIVDFLRQRKETTSLDELQESCGVEPVDGWLALGWVEQLTLRVELQRALGNLPEKYRDPVTLYLIDGAPQDEVSQLLGRPRSTVASQISRGLARLRRSLAILEVEVA